MATAKKKKSDFLIYKGRPFLRKDDIMYYGSMSDKYVVMLQVLETRQVQDTNVASKVSVQLQATGPSVKSRDRIVKKTDKDGLWCAMDIATIWLERALAAK